jgi:Ca2+-binding RTX toxin-like protein
VTGTVFADSLTGDGANNTLEGKAGNDTLNGGAGQDVAVFKRARSYYTIQETAPDQYRVIDTRAPEVQDPQAGSFSLNEGIDELSGIEVLRFADGELTLGAGLRFKGFSAAEQRSTSQPGPDPLDGYKRGTELSDSTLTYTPADKAAGLSAGVAGLGGYDQLTLEASGTYVGGAGSDSFTLGSGLSGQYTVMGSESAKLQPYQHVGPADDFDTINLGSASITSIDLTLGHISGTSAVSGSVTATPYTVNFSGIERINGASSPAGHFVTGRAPVSAFQYRPSGSDQISTPLELEQPWNLGLVVSYLGGSFHNAGITVTYNSEGIGRVTSTAFSGVVGDTLDRVPSIIGTTAADFFDMRSFGTNAVGTKTNVVGVSAGDTVIGNGETRLALPGFTLGASTPNEGSFITLPDFTRRVVVDLAEGSFEAYTSNVTNNNFNTWAGAVKFSGVQGLFGSSQDETMLGDEQDNFFRPEDGNDYVDGRGGLDELNYWRQAEPVTIDMAAGVVMGGPSNGMDTFRRIEVVTGTVHADRYDASEFGSAQAVNVGDKGSYNAYRPIGGNDVVIGNGQTHVLYDLTMLPVEVNLAQGYARARLESDRLIVDDRSVGLNALSGVNRLTGSVHADRLTGDVGNNVIEGGAGNDTIAGGLGQDVAVFSGARSFYTIQATSADQYTVTDIRAAQIQDLEKKTWSLNDGADQLSGIEVLRFSDGEFSVKGLALAPSKLSGIAYHWKSHQLLEQVHVRAIHASDVGVSPSSWFDLRGSAFDHASNTLRAEVWINPTSPVESLGFVATVPQGSSISFISRLTSDWTVLGNTTQAGRLSFGALIADANTAGLINSTLIGTVVVQVPPGMENANIDFADILDGERPVPSDALAVSDASSDMLGRYAFQALPNGQYQLTAGRTTADGQLGVTSADALAAMRLALGINPNTDPDGSGPLSAPAVSPYQFIAADVDANGKVSAADVLSILKMAVGLPSAPASEWLFVEETRDFLDEPNDRYSIDRDNASWNRAISAQQPGETNLVGALKGDVTGSWRSSTAASDSNVVPASHFEALSALMGAPLDQWHT